MDVGTLDPSCILIRTLVRVLSLMIGFGLGGRVRRSVDCEESLGNTTRAMVATPARPTTHGTLKTQHVERITHTAPFFPSNFPAGCVLTKQNARGQYARTKTSHFLANHQLHSCVSVGMGDGMENNTTSTA